MRWSRFVVIGDSFSEGMSDPDPTPPNRYVGWADRLATHLAAYGPLSYANLAIRGRLLADIVGRQLDDALALQPDLISIMGGGNDILRPGADPDRLAAALETAVARARDAGADVLMATTTDTRRAGPLARTAPASTRYTALIHGIALRHGATVVDQFTARWIQDWRMWAADRIHLTPEGHTRWAAMAADALGLPVDPSYAIPLDPADPAPVRERLAEHYTWAREFGVPWMARRIRGRSSGDGLSPKYASLTPWPPRSPAA